MKKIILITVSLFLVSTTFAADRLVPSQYPTIQAAIDAAENGDSVIVDPNTYIENIDFMGKAITVRSSEPGDWDVVKNTIIDGSEGNPWQNGSCVVFDKGEGSNSILEGFTLTNGKGTYAGYGSENLGLPPIRAGGGILCLNSSPTIRRCNIKNNGLVGREPCGGGIALLGNCQATISSCFIVNNQGRAARGGGGGILISSHTPETATSTIKNCTIANNITPVPPVWDRYQVDCWDTRPTISNTIIWANNNPPDDRHYFGGDYTRSLLIADPCLVTYSCVKDAYIFEGGYDENAEPYDLTTAGGNISKGPIFAQPLELETEELDYHLLGSSPCIDAGDPNFVGGGEMDIDGQPRVMAGRVDIGADEIVPEIIVTKPTGGDVLTSGSTHKIEWSSYGAGAVDILFSIDGSNNWQTIESGASDAGSYMWHLLRKVDSNQCLVSVVPSVPDANVICIESGLFTIRPKFHPHKKVTRKWKSLGGDFDRSGLSQDHGPEFGCVKWQFETEGPVTASVTITGRDKHRHKHEGKGKGKHKGKGKGKHKDASSDDYRVHIACEDGKLYTLDANNGALLWSYDTNTPLLSSPTIGRDGTVYVGGQNGKLYAVDFNGNLRWTQSTGGFIYSSPALSGKDKVYACSQDGVLYALRRDGSELWSFQTTGFAALNGAIFVSPAIGANGTVYIAGLYDPNLYALNPKNGSVKWNCNFASPIDPCDPNSAKKVGWPFASPAIAEDGTIYQSLVYDTNLYAMEPDTGTILWSTDLAGTILEIGPYEHLLWVGPGDPPEYIEGRRVHIIGKYRYASCWSKPALGPDGTIYVSFDDPFLRAVDPDGSLKWVSQLGTMGGFTLTVSSDGLIYAASDDNRLYVVNPDGEEIGRFESNGWLSHPVIAPGGTIIVSDANNVVWAVTQQDCGDKPLVLDVPAEPGGPVQWVDWPLYED